MSYHDARSDVSTINRHGVAHPVAVDPHTWRVLQAAQDIAATSGGLFDVTVGTVLTRLGYLPRHAHLPNPCRQGDWRDIELLPGHGVRLRRAVRIDLSGIAKGYAVDLATETLRQAGVLAGWVNAGGDLRIFGDTMQSIHVRRPSTPTHTLPLLQLAKGAVATSAGYFRARRQRGHDITPLIHTPTARPMASPRSVTVIAQDCMTADALTKVVHANPTQSMAALARFEARALIVEDDAATGACRIFQASPDIHA
jgi:thiamine biosynthesis lipoprotein